MLDGCQLHPIWSLLLVKCLGIYVGCQIHPIQSLLLVKCLGSNVCSQFHPIWSLLSVSCLGTNVESPAYALVFSSSATYRNLPMLDFTAYALLISPPTACQHLKLLDLYWWTIGYIHQCNLLGNFSEVHDTHQC